MFPVGGTICNATWFLLLKTVHRCVNRSGLVLCYGIIMNNYNTYGKLLENNEQVTRNNSEL